MTPLPVVERLEVREHRRVPLAPRAQQPKRLLRREGVREEEPQQRLVPQLDPRLEPVQPAGERRAGRRP